MNIISIYYQWKIELIRWALVEKKNVATLEMYNLRKKARKLKKFSHFMTNFYNFALKIEIS